MVLLLRRKSRTWTWESRRGRGSRKGTRERERGRKDTTLRTRQQRKMMMPTLFRPHRADAATGAGRHVEEGGGTGRERERGTGRRARAIDRPLSSFCPTC